MSRVGSGVADVVIPVFGERGDALTSTVRACLEQGAALGLVWVVDDGSPEPVRLQPNLAAEERVRLVRLHQNAGISAARMAAIRQSTTPFVACVNVDILPQRGWLEDCVDHLNRYPGVGGVYTPLVASEPGRLLTSWRMRFHEQKYDQPVGEAVFAPGHAAVFRRAALDAVGGYDIRMRRIGEDGDLGHRMRAAGWETHFIHGAPTVTIQTDQLRYLARKQLYRDGFDIVEGAPLGVTARRATRSLMNRLVRNTLTGRLQFVPVDVAVFGLGWVEIYRHHRQKHRPKKGP